MKIKQLEWKGEPDKDGNIYYCEAPAFRGYYFINDEDGLSLFWSPGDSGSEMFIGKNESIEFLKDYAQRDFEAQIRMHLE